MSKLWAGRAAGDINPAAEAFNASITFDKRLFREDITGSIAHASMLGKQGIISKEETNTLIVALGEILSDLEAGTLAVDEKALPATNLRLAGGGIDLCGFTHTVTNLVGSGTISNGTLVVVGKVWPGYGDNGELVVAADATLSATNLSYSVDSTTGASGALVVNGPFDLSGVTIAVENPEATGPRGLVLIKGPVTGTPMSDEEITVGNGKVRFRAPGMTMFIY